MELSDLFDDIVKDEYGTWTQVCKAHSKNPLFAKIGKLSDCASENTICGCAGCKNKAEYYLDIDEIKKYRMK